MGPNLIILFVFKFSKKQKENLDFEKDRFLVMMVWKAVVWRKRRGRLFVPFFGINTNHTHTYNNRNNCCT